MVRQEDQMHHISNRYHQTTPGNPSVLVREEEIYIIKEGYFKEGNVVEEIYEREIP